MKKEGHFYEGATRITYITKNDDRRSKFRCIHLKQDKKTCMMLTTKCVGSSHCLMYKEKPSDYTKQKVVHESIKKNQKKIVRINQRVKHKNRGMGTITSVNGEVIKVRFDTGELIKLNLEICLKNNIMQIL
ncbi:MAG: hypothetical protein Q4D77_03820 [Peptostreptococcaceae bacterium]|nr:hypothetical protein [Peptostreptococcaceae bacterium]